MTTGRRTAVGVFTERLLAENALEALHHAAYTDDQLGFVTREGAVASTSGRDLEASPGETNVPTTAAGAVGGGVLGGAVAAAVALLIPGLGPALVGGILGGAAIGALAGGFAGSLTSMGVPEEEARYYQEQLAAGRTLVTVSDVSPERYQIAVSIMRQNGAYDAVVKDDLLVLDNEGATPASDFDGKRQEEDQPPTILTSTPGMTTSAPDSMSPLSAWPVPPSAEELAARETRIDELPTVEYPAYRQDTQTAASPEKSAVENQDDVVTESRPRVKPEQLTAQNEAEPRAEEPR